MFENKVEEKEKNTTSNSNKDTVVMSFINANDNIKYS